MEIRGNYSRGVVFKGGYELGKYGLRIKHRKLKLFKLKCKCNFILLSQFHIEISKCHRVIGTYKILVQFKFSKKATKI